MCESTSGSGRIENYSGPKTATEHRLGLEAHATDLLASIDEAAKRLDQLESRLSPIVVPSPPTPQADVAPSAAQIRSQMLNASLEAQRRVNGITRHIESLLNRIEL